MKLTGKVAALEKAAAASVKQCSVTYKVGQGPEGEIFMPMDKALQEARTGHVKEIHFPLTFNEEQAEHLYAREELDRWFSDTVNGYKRDTDPPSTDRLIFCTKPIVFARQAPPKSGVGGNLITEDGTPFHQTEWREVLTKYNAGFIIIRDYDETKEPWYKERSNNP